MISFACQDIEFADLIRCSFELSKSEIKLLFYLLRTEEQFTASELAKVFNQDRTTIQKAIKKLAEKNLVYRKQINLDKGGYLFYYSIKEKKDIKKRMRKIVEDWYDQVVNEIDKW